MKVISSIYLIIFCCYSASAQKMPSDYFEVAYEFYEKKDFDKALAAYQYIVDHYPQSEFYSKSFYNVGNIYYTQKEFDKAIPIFKAILNSNFDEKEKLGGDMMGNPYANFRHNASDILSDIYYEKEKYDSALQYLALSETNYPYFHFCGNALAESTVYIALRYANIYKKTLHPELAIKKLLPMAFILFADNSRVIEELRILLKDKPGIKVVVDSSFEGIYGKQFEINGSCLTEYYIAISGTEVPITETLDTQGNLDKQKTIEYLKLTKFYRMIEEL